MTTIAQIVDVAPPPNADLENIDNWEVDGTTTGRLVWSKPMPLPDSLSASDVRIVATQRPDGSIVAGNDIECPMVYVGGDDYSITEVRELVQALTAAADLADRWIGHTVTAGGGRMSHPKKQLNDELTPTDDIAIADPEHITGPDEVAAGVYVGYNVFVHLTIAGQSYYLNPDDAVDLGYALVDAEREAVRAAWEAT